MTSRTEITQNESLIPTTGLRWGYRSPFPGELCLQQRFLTTGGQERWIDVPFVEISPDPKQPKG